MFTTSTISVDYCAGDYVVHGKKMYKIKTGAESLIISLSGGIPDKYIVEDLTTGIIIHFKTSDPNWRKATKLDWFDFEKGILPGKWYKYRDDYYFILSRNEDEINYHKIESVYWSAVGSIQYRLLKNIPGNIRTTFGDSIENADVEEVMKTGAVSPIDIAQYRMAVKDA